MYYPASTFIYLTPDKKTVKFLGPGSATSGDVQAFFDSDPHLSFSCKTQFTIFVVKRLKPAGGNHSETPFKNPGLASVWNDITERWEVIAPVDFAKLGTSRYFEFCYVASVVTGVDDPPLAHSKDPRIIVGKTTVTGDGDEGEGNSDADAAAPSSKARLETKLTGDKKKSPRVAPEDKRKS